jgi:hypothetical protein
MTAVSIPPTNRTNAIEALSRFLHSCHPGKPLTVMVEREKAERSSQQNKALFGHAYKVIAAETGLSGRDELEKLHRDMCCRYFGERTLTVLGRTYRQPLRTTTTDENGNKDVLGVVEFSAFYGYVERLAAECGIFIAAPDPRWFLEGSE